MSDVVVINESGLDDDLVLPEIQKKYPELAALSDWSTYNTSRSRLSSGRDRYQTLFDRDRFVSPDGFFDKFKVAADAVELDDVVAGVVETTEQLAFKRIALEMDNEDEQSVWNQIADNMDLAQRMREIWRELFMISQCYVAVYYGRQNFKVKKRNKSGRPSKKTFNGLLVPKAISLLDPCKVVPVGNFMFGKEQLAYIANEYEIAHFEKTLAGGNTSDLVVSQLFTGKYEISKEELRLLQETVGDGYVSMKNLYLLNPKNTFRITSTKPSYQKFATVRMESVFELLDLKRQLRQSDRASLIGSTNAIILVKRGSKEHPASAQEMQALATQVGGTSKQPIIVGDYTLEVEIVTPKTDKTLAAERHNAIDSRITSRLYQILASGNYASGTATDNSAGLFRVIASSMEARRDNIRDALMNNVFQKTWEDNDELIDEPKMGFYPRRIALDFDPTIAQYLQALRDRGDISRDTVLAELDILEEDELQKRIREAEEFDDHFMPPNNVPFDSPNHPGATGQPPANKQEQRNAGRAGGGNNNGGGSNPASSQPSPPKK